MKKILYLTLKKKWFDLIASGEKTIEYREAKPYWVKRLLDAAGKAKDFDEVHFRNGYGKKAPFMRVEFISLGLIQDPAGCFVKNGEELSGPTFYINLGRVLEVRRG